jgi:hypothetical protein
MLTILYLVSFRTDLSQITILFLYVSVGISQFEKWKNLLSSQSAPSLKAARPLVGLPPLKDLRQGGLCRISCDFYGTIMP